ncbi:hydroxyethylthiazole kinase [Streptococcus moroccensis]|uniref:Hydroxyethylthiazole kinase n=1 Tax=Streptococcus moroccensis TaxID=1451356 RepID=A0ABT9YTP9_9STRE|nr:hydroxyethylthiazole kinase [Streptococcus moroccensis]MDQ0223375.1 hydroxyethylthiazole kinase [Streptococcus moroccensis]
MKSYSDRPTCLPLNNGPLVHAITNSISNEFVANSLLAIGAKSMMTEDRRELPTVIKVADALFLNLGQMTLDKENVIKEAACLANQYHKPMVVDAVGITQLPNRLHLVKDLLRLTPQVVKGNTSEIRALLGLSSQARGVDGWQADQSGSRLMQLGKALKDFSKAHPETCFLATGPTDIVAVNGKIWWLTNGSSNLDRITGTGDVVGALIAGFLGDQLDKLEACLQGVTYFNLCGEKAAKRYPNALGSFRQELLDQLGCLYREHNWQEAATIREEKNE